MDKYIGRLLDNRYEILEVIGTGGMAVVYKARCHRLNRLVAIKILKDDYLQDEEFRRRFHSESQAVAMLSHPNIVSVYDVSTSIMADYIVMELIEGITLKQYMEKKGVLNWKETLHFAIQIAKALEHAHGRGIVHRDIKPHNVMVLKNGSVKVTDFGIARMMSQGNTLTKEALGSVHYISPEQAKGGRVDSRSDIYSLGVVMYEMMAGRPPYDGDSPVAVAIKHINGGAPLPSTFNPNIPGGLEQIIMKAMGHELHERYVSATRMLSDMDEFRKDPTILFDYNTPPLDVVTKITPTPLELHPEKTTADKVVEKADPARRRTAQEAEARRKERAQEAKRQQRKKAENRDKAATIAVICCAAAIIVALIIGIVVFVPACNDVRSNPDLVSVPDLSGKMFDEVKDDYPDLSLIPKDVYDDTVPKGQIITQKPLGGEQVAKGTKLVVDVSKGPMTKPITIGNMTGMTEDQVRTFLDSQSLNLNIVRAEEHSDTVPEGGLVRTDPGEGAELQSGQTVTIYISKGPAIKTTTMPELSNMTLDRAKKLLEDYKMELVVTEELVFDNLVSENTIIKTEPAFGEKLQTGQTVKLWVSKGVEKKQMPNVVGLDIEKAVSIIIQAGFKMPVIEQVESDQPKDEVVSQSHEKNTEIEVTTQIVLEISKGPAETVPPAVTKDVTLGLYGVTDDGPCQVKVTRDGNTVWEGEIPQGQTSLVIPKQTGSGTVFYTITVAGMEPWTEQVVF